MCTVNDTYICAFCHKRHVKLWRPQVNSGPLICAKCAEIRQSERKCPEYNWIKNSYGYEGIQTGKMLIMDRWKVDEKGKIPSPYQTGPNEYMKINEFLLDFKNKNSDLSLEKIHFVPAIPGKDEKMYSTYSPLPEDRYRWWENLPTN